MRVSPDTSVPVTSNAAAELFTSLPLTAGAC